MQMHQTKPRRLPGLCLVRSELRLGFFVLWLGSCCGGGGGAGLGFVAWLADVDAALEEGAVFDGNACGDDVAGERAFAADVDAIGGLAVAADLAENDDLASADVGGYLAVAADGDAVAGEVDGAFDFTVDVEGFGTGDLAFDYETLADGGLLAVRNRTWGGGGCAGSESRCCSGRSRTHRLWSRGRIARLVWFPHRSSVPFLGGGLLVVAVVAPVVMRFRRVAQRWLPR